MNAAAHAWNWKTPRCVCLLMMATGILLTLRTPWLRAEEPAADVKLTGIITFSGKKQALLELANPERPPLRPICREGERVENVEILSIDAQAGKVTLRQAGQQTVVGFAGPPISAGTNKPSAAETTFRLVSADLGQVLDIYAALADRTLLYSAMLPHVALTVSSDQPVSPREALQALDKALAAKGILMKPDGAKFVFALRPEQAERLPAKLALAATNAAAGDEILPAGSLRFTDTDFRQVLEIYQDLSKRTAVLPESLPAVKISFRNQTELTLNEAIYAFDQLFALNNLAVVPLNEKFVKILPAAELDKKPKSR